MIIIHGTDDSLVPYQNVGFMEKEFTNVSDLKVISLKGEDHFIVWTKEKLIKDSLLDWVN